MDYIKYYEKYLNFKTKTMRNYVANCPFHADFTASLAVDPIMGGFNCLGCGKHGNLIRFLELLQTEKGIDTQGDIINFKQQYKEEQRLKARREEIDAKDLVEAARTINFKEYQQNETIESMKNFDLDEIKENYKNLNYKYISTYEYYNVNGQLLYKKHRFQNSNEKKFIFETDGKIGIGGQKQVPYGLEQFKYNSNCSNVWLTEGEKCKDAIIDNASNSVEDIVVLGFHKASDIKNVENFERLFENKNVIVFEDNDETGKNNTKDIVMLLKNIAKTIKVVSFSSNKKGYDVADFLAEHGWNDLIEIVNKTPYVVNNAKQTNDNINSNEQTNIKYEKGLGVDSDDEDSFILEPYIPKNAYILFDGIGELGKSLIAMQLSLCIAVGKKFLSDNIKAKEPNRVLYFTAEETRSNFRNRLKKLVDGLSINEQEMELVEKNFMWKSVITKDFYATYKTCKLLKKEFNNIIATEFYKALEQDIQIIKPKLVILDSLIDFFGIGLDENSSSDAMAFVESLVYLCNSYNISFLVLHHQNKQNDNIFRGSSVLREQSRARITISKANNNATDVKKLAIEKLNYFSPLREDKHVRLATKTENGESVLCFVEVNEPTINSKNNNDNKPKISI